MFAKDVPLLSKHFIRSQGTKQRRFLVYSMILKLAALMTANMMNKLSTERVDLASLA